MDSDQQRRTWVLPESLRALRYPNYRLFISGQIISLTGTWIEGTALSWLVYNLLTNSSFYLGLLNFGAQIPILILGLLTGMIADSVNRRKLLIRTQCLFMITSTILAILTLTHNSDGVPYVTFWLAFSLATFSGILKAFDMPTRQAFLLELVPRHELPNAVALNSLTFNAARIIGPSIAGILIAQVSQIRPQQQGFGEGISFAINAITYLAMIYCLVRMKVTPREIPPPPENRLRFMTDGIRYVRRQRHVNALMIHLMFMALFGIPYLIIMPVYAREVLGGAANEFGSLMTAVGIGAVIGGVIMTRRASVKGLGSHMAYCVLGFSAVLVMMAINSNFKIALILLAFAGFFMVMAMISSQTLVQVLLPEDIRGRVMSLYGMISLGFLPLGSLLIGALAEHYGVRIMLAINAIICATATLYFIMKLPKLRESAMNTPEYRAAVGLDSE